MAKVRGWYRNEHGTLQEMAGSVNEYGTVTFPHVPSGGILVENESSAQEENVPETFEDLLDDYAFSYYGQYEGVPVTPTKEVEKARQICLDTVARLEARQITPDLIALYRKLQAGRRVDSEDEAFLYPGEQHRVMEDILLALGKMIEGGE